MPELSPQIFQPSDFASLDGFHAGEDGLTSNRFYSGLPFDTL